MRYFFSNGRNIFKNGWFRCRDAYLIIINQMGDRTMHNKFSPLYNVADHFVILNEEKEIILFIQYFKQADI